MTNALRLRLFKPKTSPSVVEAPKHEEIKTKENTIMKTVIKVNGMMCGHCKAHVETACKGVPGVTDAVVDLDAKNVTVTGDADVAALKKATTSMPVMLESLDRLTSFSVLTSYNFLLMSDMVSPPFMFSITYSSQKCNNFFRFGGKSFKNGLTM